MGILNKIFGKSKKEEVTNQVDHTPNVQDNVWDESLEYVSEQEMIRYRIYKRLGELKRGDIFNLETVFGNDGVSADEYMAFLEVFAKLMNPFPVYETPEKLHEAESNLKDDDAGIMCRIANTYLGQGDLAEAFDWYNQAADHGDSTAMCRLGGMYKHGHGVEQSTDKAIQWYKKAVVADGNREALLDLGLCYLKGEGVPKDIDKGFFLMQRSANQGNMQAQYNMGVIYRMSGSADDMEKALYWYRLSANQGYEEAVDFLNQYENGNMNRTDSTN